MAQSKELDFAECKVRHHITNAIFVISLIVIGSAWFYILVSGWFKIRDIIFGG